MESIIEIDRRAVPPARATLPSLPGREEEVRLVCGAFTPEQPIQWLLGDSGTGKSTLIHSGIAPAWKKGPVVSIRVATRARHRPVIGAIAARLLATATPPAKLAARLRQFEWLLEKSSTESAADYLADCLYRPGNRPLIVIDQLERLIHGDTAAWIEWLRFIEELGATGAFSILLSARTDAGEIVRMTQRRAGLAEWPEPVAITDLPVGTVTCIRSGTVPVEKNLRLWLVNTVRDWPGALPFAAQLVEKLARDFRGPGPLELPPDQRAAALGALFAASAERALDGVPAPVTAAAWPRLMAALYPDHGDLSHLKPVKINDLDPSVGPLIDPLVDAGILRRSGPSPADIAVCWSWGPGLAWWDRAGIWIDERHHLDSRLAAFQSALQLWDGDGRSSVRLLHAAPLITDARRLLEDHRFWPRLTEDMVGYLEESIALDDQVRGEWRHRRNRKHLLIGGAAAAAVAGIVMVILSAIG